ncbi:unnamed protein product, partial [Pleuronectes platessa]
GTEQAAVRRWMISLEGHVICEGIQQAFVTGLAALFSVYYIVNLHYQEEAACTLEFIQRLLCFSGDLLESIQKEEQRPVEARSSPRGQGESF